jgi:hypothetical protein
LGPAKEVRRRHLGPKLDRRLPLFLAKESWSGCG